MYLSVAVSVIYVTYIVFVYCTEQRDSKHVRLCDKLWLRRSAKLHSCISGKNGYQVSVCSLHTHFELLILALVFVRP